MHHRSNMLPRAAGRCNKKTAGQAVSIIYKTMAYLVFATAIFFSLIRALLPLRSRRK